MAFLRKVSQNQLILRSGTRLSSVAAQTEVEWETAKPFAEIPGPKSFFDAVRKFLPGGAYYKKNMLQVNGLMREEYGDLVMVPGILGRRPMVMTFSADDVAKVFRTEGHWPTRRGNEVFNYYRNNVNKQVFGTVGGLIGEQGEDWAKFRTTVNPIMLQPKNVRLYVEKVDAVAKDFIEIIKKIRDANNETPANFGDYLNRWSLESIGVIALDTRLGVLDENSANERARTIINSVRDFFTLTVELEIKPSLWRYFSTPSYKKMLQSLDNLTEAIMHYINEALDRIEKNPTRDPNQQGVLEKLLQQDRQTALIMAHDMLLAGVDTTSSVSTIVLYHLAKNPEKQQILREEILRVLPEQNSALTSESVKNLPYLRAAIKESIRMTTPILGNFRATGQDIVLQGYKVPKGIDVAMNAATMYADNEYFPKSDEFLPERWLKNVEPSECPVGKGKAHPFKYVPFGFGPRACIGKRFAELEIETLVMRLLREFKIEWHHPDLTFDTGVVTFAVDDLKFKLTELEK